MFLSVEQTAYQTLPKSVVSACNQVTITHLPTHSLTKSIDTVKKINDQAGTQKAVPHIAARNLQSEAELLNSCQAFFDEGVNTVLIIGGDRKFGNYYSSAFEICQVIKGFRFKKICGVYPQTESFSYVKNKKYSSFSEGITQFCLKPAILNQFQESTRIGVPSQCSIQQLIKFAKRCGLLQSFKMGLQNIEGIRYFDYNGFKTKHFVNRLANQRIHVYNFGKLENTVASLCGLA